MATVTGTKRLLDISGNNISTAVSLEASGTLLDVNGTAGTSGQVLSSTGSGVDWITNTDNNFYLNGITKSGDTLTFSVLGATNQAYTFGSNAFTSTAIPTVNNATVTINTAAGLDGGTSFTLNQSANKTINLALDLNELAAGGTLIGTDSLVAVNGTTSNKQLISSIPLSIFNNNSVWTSNTGTVTGVTSGNVDTITVSTSSTTPVVTAITGSVNSSSNKLATGSQIQSAINTAIGTIPSGLAFEGNWNASTGNPPSASPGNGQFWIVSVAGSTNLSGITDWEIGDWAIYVDNGAGTDAWQKVDNSSTLSGLGATNKVAFWSTTSNVSFNNNFSYDGTYLTAPRMRVGDGTDGYFYSDSAGRTAFTGGDFYIQSNVSNAFNYATNNYHGSTSGDNQLFRGNPLSGDNWSIATTGIITAPGGTSTEWNTAYDNSVTALAVTGTTTKTLTATQQDGGTLTASWTDNNDNTNWYVNAATFSTSTGVITGTGVGSAGFTVDIDGRYPVGNVQDNSFYLHLNQNPVGTTYGQGVATVPTYYFGQKAGDNDGMRFYTESAATNDVTAVWEIIDDIETGLTWLFRNKKTYSPYTATDALKIDGDGDVTVGKDLTVTGGDIVLSGTGRIQGVDTVSATTDAANKAYVDASVPSLTNYVTLNTAQTITGAKTFNNDVTLNNTYLLGVDKLEANQIVIGTSTSSILGNVGIGTTSPDFKLDVAGDVRIENLHGLYFGGDTSTTFKWGMASSGADLVINNNNTNGDVTFINDGNVGIGTTSPDALLHVRAATNVTGTIEVQGGKATVTSAGEINSELNFGSNDSSATGGIGGSIKSVTENTNGAYVGMSFYTAKQGRTPVLEEAMRIDQDGNVGIGTTSPQSTRKLDVAGHIQGSQNLYLGVAGTNLSSNSIEIGQGRTGNGFAYMDLTGDATYTDYGLRIIRDNTGANASSQIVHRGTGDFSITTTEGADILLIPNSGNVGIGTTSPDTLLQTTNTADGTDYISYEIGNTAVNASNKGGFAIYELGTKQVTLEYYRDGSAITNLSTPHSFTIDTNSQERMQISNAGAIKFNNYGAGTLVTDASGNITAATSGPGTGTVTGTGTDNTIPLWNGTTGLDNSAITQTAVGAISIHETNPLNAVDFNIKAIAHYCSMRMKGAAGSGADISFYDNLTYLAGIVGVPGGELHFNTSTNIATNGLALSLNNVQEARFHSSGIDGTMKNPILFGASGGASGSGIGQENRIRSSVSQTRANNILKFETATNTVGTFNENQLVLDGMGNVGIGTTSPNQKLHVNGATQLGDISATVSFGTVALKVVEGTISTGPTLGSGTVGAQAVLYSNGQFGMYTGVSNNGDTWMQSQRNDTGTSTYDILLNPAGGNIGIGTTTPTHKLDVAGDIRLQSDNQIYFGATGSIPYWTAGVDNTTNNNFVIGGASYYTGDRDILLNPVNNGNVGIKTTSPSYELDVVGDIRARGNGTGNIYVGTYGARLSNYYSSITTNAEFRVGYAGGTYAICRASAFTVTSDYRLKEKIVPLTDSLDRLGQLNVYKFNWIDKPNEEPVDGFIAHEVAEVIPEAVVGVKDEIGPDGKPEYQGLDQAKIVPLLTAALQESITKIEQLEQRIQTLENK